MDEAMHIAVKGGKKSEKSNSALVSEDRPTPSQESFVAFR